MLSRDSEDAIWSRFVFELVIWPKEVTLVRWTQPSGPLCLWQCFLQYTFFFWSWGESEWRESRQTPNGQNKSFCWVDSQQLLLLIKDSSPRFRDLNEEYIHQIALWAWVQHWSLPAQVHTGGCGREQQVCETDRWPREVSSIPRLSSRYPLEPVIYHHTYKIF